MASFVPSSGSPSPSSSPGLRKNLEIVRLQTKRQEELDQKLGDLQGFQAGSDRVDYSETMSYGRPASRAQSLSPSSSAISPITGVTIEHRMISDLRNQLEDQATENRKLRQQIDASTTRQTYSLTGFGTSSPPSATLGTVQRSFSDSRVSMHVPVSETVESILARGSARSPIQNVPHHTESAIEVLLRKQLTDAQAEIALLKEKLRQNESGIGQQKAKFRSAIEELQARLNETIVGRDSVLQLRKQESQGQEKMIGQLQQTVKDLDSANRQQEKSLLEANHNISSLQQAATSSSTALQQIHLFLSSSADRPRPDHRIASPGYASPHRSEEEGGRTLPPSHVVRLVEEGLRRRQGRIKDLERTLGDLKKELGETKQEAEEKVRALGAENREKLLHLSEDQAKQLEALSERATNARQQAAGLQAQLADLQDQTAKQTSVATMELSTLRSQYETLKAEADTERQQSRQTIDDMTDELDAYRNNMSAAREEISSLQLKLADANLTIQSNKETLTSLQDRLKEEQERTREMRSQEGQRLVNIQKELEARSLEVRHLEDMLTSHKDQAHAQLQQMIFEVQCEEQKKAIDKTSQLLAEIESLTAEKSKLSLEMQKKTSECDQSNQSRDRLSSVLEETSAKLEAVQSDSGNATKHLEEKSKLVDVLTQERDHYQRMCEERSRELDSAASIRTNLQAQVAEREVRYEEIIQEKINLAQVIESRERSNADALQEKDHLLKLLDDKTKEVEEVKGLKDDLNRKLKVREKRVQTLEVEVKSLTDAVKDKRVEVEKVIEGKAGLVEELRSFQDRVTHLTTEREVLGSRFVEAEASREKSSSHQQLRIQALEHDLQLTLGALRATKSADARAVDVADSLQQELTAKRSQVDSLQTVMHGLEETLSSSNKEKSVLVVEKERLEDQVSRMKGLVERLQDKLQGVADKRSSQKEVVSKLETALEKAALKHTDAQQVIEKQEQAIAKMALKHQLEMKALQRTLATKLANPKSASIHRPPSPPQNLKTLEKMQHTESVATLAKFKSSAGREKASAGVVSAHFLQSASIQAMEGLAGRNYISPVPVVILNTSGNRVDSEMEKRERLMEQETDQNISAELKDLLQEVKSVFSANVAALKTANSGHHVSGPEVSHDRFKSSLEESGGIYALKRPDDHRNLFMSARDTQSAPELEHSSLKTEDVMDPPLLTSSPFKMEDFEVQGHLTPPLQGKASMPKRDFELDAPPSPVTNLLGLHAGIKSNPTLHGNNDAVHGVNEPKGAQQRANRTTKGGVNGAVKHNANGTTASSYGVKRPSRHAPTGASTRKTENTVKGGFVHTTSRAVQGSDPSVNKKPSRQNVKFVDVNGSHAQHNGRNDVSIPLRSRAPELGDLEYTRKVHSRTVHTMNLANKDDFGRGLGDVKYAAPELIISDDDYDDGSSVTTVTSVSSGVTSTNTGDPPSNNLKSLRERLATLSQMGNQLQKGNKEMAGLIKRQDVKLKHCRQEERQAKRIINSK